MEKVALTNELLDVSVAVFVLLTALFLAVAFLIRKELQLTNLTKSFVKILSKNIEVQEKTSHVISDAIDNNMKLQQRVKELEKGITEEFKNLDTKLDSLMEMIQNS